ncbi:hypothetical protein [Gordonia sp. ABSL49_1]|uniref:hypothetical protein n=1 Tax=Gordonia sp. ABSL49_1 TaxID=2920941 RepID=UPI001F11197D|nr:hypothetical protein [Gordonia sp. ABSL49_1]MCH5645182.1 hypothetical protein [Gordonia sp. ABSL49_1]
MAEISFTIDDGFLGATAVQSKRLGFRPRTEFVGADGSVIYKRTAYTNYTVGVEHTIDLEPGPWELHGVRTPSIQFDVPDEGGALQDLITLGIPNGSPVTSLTAAVDAWLDAQGITPTDNATVAGYVASSGATRAAVDARVTEVGDARYSQIPEGSTAPSSPAVGDLWLDTSA